MQKIYLGLGTNLGNRQTHLKKALYYIERLLGTIIATSNIYETQPWGVSEQPNFLNMVVEVQSCQSPQNTLSTILTIEQFIGRVRLNKWGSRAIDIDLLFYGEEVINEPNLKIPHPYIPQRNFVLVPLKEIAEDLLHPVLKVSIHELYTNCKDTLSCKKLLDN